MRFVDKAGILVIFISGGMAYLAGQFHMPFLIPPAIAIFGCYALLLGVDTFIQGKFQLFDRYYNLREHYSGLSARLLSVIFFLFGAMLVVYAAVEWLAQGMAEKYLTVLVESNRGWGILLITFGLFTLLFGLVRLISGSAHSPDERNRWTDFGFRTLGLIGSLAGFLLIVAGCFLLIYQG